jgi:hypothetical protein
MALEPSGYNHVDQKTNKVRFVCACGWRTRPRQPGKPPKAVIFRAFHCPKCQVKLSDFTADS